MEFAQFIIAMDAWTADHENFECLMQAIHHFEVYDIRRADAVTSPTGLSIPANRALLANYWMENLRSASLLDEQGKQVRWNQSAATFWDTVRLLRDERDRLFLQDSFTVSGHQ